MNYIKKVKELISAEQRCPWDLLFQRLVIGLYRLDEDGELEKRCPKCKEYHPADSEFFYATKSEPDGLAAWCKACYLEWLESRKKAA